MATIKEQAAAIKGYAADIDAAIVAKGGTTTGGLRNAVAAIEALPSGGGADLAEIEGWLQKTSTKIDFTKILDPSINYMIATSWSNSGQLLRNNTKVVELYAPNITANAAYFAAGCTSMTTATVRVLANVGYVFQNCNNLKDIFIIGTTANAQLRNSAAFNQLPTTATLHCTDADIKYIDGAWTIVERS